MERIEFEDLSKLPYNPNCYVAKDGTKIYKVRGADVQDKILDYYHLLSSSGIPVGEVPTFFKDPYKGLVEVSSVNKGTDGQTYLLHASSEDAINYFSEVIMHSVLKVLVSQKDGKTLHYSIDPVPHNYVDGKYIDYWEPVTSSITPGDSLLDPQELVNYAIVRSARAYPEVIYKFVDKAKEKLIQADIKIALLRPYLARDLTQIKLNLLETNNEEDLQGLLTVITNKLTKQQIQELRNSINLPLNTQEQLVKQKEEQKLRDIGLDSRWVIQPNSILNVRRLFLQDTYFKIALKQGFEAYKAVVLLGIQLLSALEH